MLLDVTRSLPTPALVVDLAAAEHNIVRATDCLASFGVRLRPHFKAHKCTRLMARQIGSGRGRGVTCATAHEAEVLAGAGFDDLLIANEVADPGGLAALARAAEQADVTVCIDDPRHVELLEATGAAVGVLVEIDVGQHRCGLAPGDPALLELARLVAATSRLRFRGLQGYVGHAVLLPDRGERLGHVEAAAAILREGRARLEAAGFACELVSGGGTGTLDLGAGALDEVQAGSYVLMDASYDKLGLGFKQALFCRATVVSRRGDRVVLDAGLKALSAEYGMPRSTDGAFEVESLADEHAVARVGSGVQIGVGDGVLLIPAHVDPTVNLHAALHVVAEDGGVEAWRVDARRT